jgi:hypothetical protein
MGLKKNQKILLVIPKWGLDEFKLKRILLRLAVTRYQSWMYLLGIRNLSNIVLYNFVSNYNQHFLSLVYLFKMLNSKQIYRITLSIQES